MLCTTHFVVSGTAVVSIKVYRKFPEPVAAKVSAVFARAYVL